MRRFIPWICLLAVFIPLAVTSTTPAQGPLLSYRLNGVLLDNRGKPLGGRTVAFATRCQSGYLVLDDVNGCTCSQGERPGAPSAVTSADGSFSLDLISCEMFDSLTIAVADPRPVITKQVVAVKDAQQQDWNEQVPNQSTGYFFCATTTGYSTVRIGVVYTFSDYAVTMSPNSP